MNEKDIHHELARLESRLAWLTTEQARVEGRCDQLRAELIDLDGAHSQRFVGAR